MAQLNLHHVEWLERQLILALPDNPELKQLVSTHICLILFIDIIIQIIISLLCIIWNNRLDSLVYLLVQLRYLLNSLPPYGKLYLCLRANNWTFSSKVVHVANGTRHFLTDVDVSEVIFQATTWPVVDTALNMRWRCIPRVYFLLILNHSLISWHWTLVLIVLFEIVTFLFSLTSWILHVQLLQFLLKHLRFLN